MRTIKKILLLFVVGLLSYTAYGQDIMYKKDGTKDSVIVKEVTPIEIVYKRYRRPEGPTYRIYKSKILLIEYADGTVEVYNNTPTVTNGNVQNTVNNDTFTHKLGRNIISINYLHILNGNIHLGYERITKNGIAGLKLSVNFNVDNVDSDILTYQRDFTTGLDLNLYPTGQGKIKYFLGPSFRVGTVSERYNSRTRGDVIDYYNYFGVFFNNGFNIQPTQNLYLGFQGALGIGRFNSQQGNINLTDVDGIFAFNMGYRF